MKGDGCAVVPQLLASAPNRERNGGSQAGSHSRRGRAALAAGGRGAGFVAYDEPPGWYYPVRESLGAALLLAGRAAEAEAVFREGVKRSPRNGRTLFGLMESLRAQGKQQDTEWVKREFDAAWAKADVTLKVEEL